MFLWSSLFSFSSFVSLLFCPSTSASERLFFPSSFASNSLSWIFSPSSFASDSFSRMFSALIRSMRAFSSFCTPLLATVLLLRLSLSYFNLLYSMAILYFSLVTVAMCCWRLRLCCFSALRASSMWPVDMCCFCRRVETAAYIWRSLSDRLVWEDTCSMFASTDNVFSAGSSYSWELCIELMMPLFSLFLISSSICSVDYLLSGWLLCRLMMSLNPSNALKSGMMPPQIVSKCFALSKTVSSFFGKIKFFFYFCNISSMHFMTPSIAVFLS